LADGVWATPCASISYDLNSQAEVDAFGQTGCTIVIGALRIHDSTDIANLDKLVGITRVGNFVIEYNDSLTNFDGLSNLTSSEGGLLVIWNESLFDCKGIVQLLEGFRGTLSLDSEQYIDVNNNAAGCNGVLEILRK
jgi:hypothetical protein